MYSRLVCQVWRKSLIVLWGATLFLNVLHAHAECVRSYEVGISEFGYTGYRLPDGTLGGFLIDLYREAAKRSGCRIDVELMPPKRVLLMREQNKIGLLGPTVFARIADHPGAIFIPLFHNTTDLIIDARFHAAAKKDIWSDKRIVFGVIRGASYGEWIDRILPQLPRSQVETVDSIASVYRMMDAGRVNATFGNPYAYRWQMASMQNAGQFEVLALPQLPPITAGVALFQPAIDAADMDILAHAVESIRDDGTFQRYMARYLGEATAQAQMSGMVNAERITADELK